MARIKETVAKSKKASKRKSASPKKSKRSPKKTSPSMKNGVKDASFRRLVKMHVNTRVSKDVYPELKKIAGQTAQAVSKEVESMERKMKTVKAEEVKMVIEQRWGAQLGDDELMIPKLPMQRWIRSTFKEGTRFEKMALVEIQRFVEFLLGEVIDLAEVGRDSRGEKRMLNASDIELSHEALLNKLNREM